MLAHPGSLGQNQEGHKIVVLLVVVVVVQMVVVVVIVVLIVIVLVVVVLLVVVIVVVSVAGLKLNWYTPVHRTGTYFNGGTPYQHFWAPDGGSLGHVPLPMRLLGVQKF